MIVKPLANYTKPDTNIILAKTKSQKSTKNDITSSTKKILNLIEFIKEKNKFFIQNAFDANGTREFLASKEVAMREIKISDEIIEGNQKKVKFNNNNINENENNKNNKNKEVASADNSKINNLITYNINKNNNYNIINSEINNFNNFVQNQNINSIKPIEDNKREPLKEKENEQERKARKERKASVAFERFKRMNRMNTAESEVQKSDKISGMAKMLENHIGGPRRENSVDVGAIRNNINNDFNNDIVNIIDSQPVVNKKKKKMRSFSYDA